ncbi:UNVERIFIED_CONTAM: hypothetical protein Sradi_3139300 [Sesamum radiatum]|uniref:Reverse transcriptase domain-containing protein n=1 Tax=Sesamum radiatum TaxID=300843 RepID=A0AAW2RET1_SESRA
MEDFCACLMDLGLIPVPTRGAVYTWNNCSDGQRSLWKKLDHMFVNDRWYVTWPSSICLNITPRMSDHSPLVLCGYSSQRTRGLFRFDNYLATLSGFLDSVKGVWQHAIHGTPIYSITQKLKALKPAFQEQRRVKRASQKIFRINSTSGYTIVDKAGVATEFVKFFKDLLGGQRRADAINIMYLRPWASYIVTQEEGDATIRPVDRAEIKETLFDIHEDKGPDPDGFTSGFFEAAWPIVGDDITTTVQDFFHTGKLLKLVNATVLNLIPKGDPMSPFLFVLSMEVLQLLLAQLVEQSKHFQFHWQCKKVNLISLCFADDILLFSRADERSITLFRDGLSSFADWSGLRTNITKNQFILSKSELDARSRLLSILDFQEGCLPVRYLGLPMISSRLTATDCKPLLQKLDEMLKGWSTVQLSYAARIQLLQAVISAMNIYWYMTFILPKSIIRIIEGRDQLTLEELPYQAIWDVGNFLVWHAMAPSWPPYSSIFLGS